jgi:predicted DNA-binding ribbon-helix-helix protein
VVRGKTNVSLEAVFWNELQALAQERNKQKGGLPRDKTRRDD